MRRIFKIDNVALVQKIAHGGDFRIVILDGHAISAYQRTPLSIVGDGISTIEELRVAKMDELSSSDRDTLIEADEFRLALTLKQNERKPEDILEAGEALELVPNANLCSGGTSIDFTDRIHPDFIELCTKIAADMGLRYRGIDLMIDGRIDEKPDKYVVIEVNSAPGLDNFVASGDKQEQIVENLYLRILESIKNL